MSSYLYLFHGYDATNAVLCTLSIERLKIKINEADMWGDQDFHSHYAIKNDIAPSFIRCYNSVYAYNSENKIVYFGYSEFQKGCNKCLEQTEFRKSDDDIQKNHQLTMTDEFPRHNKKKYRLEKDKDEYASALLKVQKELRLKDQEKNLIEEEYLHHPIFFGGLVFLPILKEKSLAYFDEQDGRYKMVPDIEELK